MKLMFTNAVLSAVTSSKVVVSPAAASKLTILTQPSSSATAGVPFAQQPQVRIEDQFGNLRSGDNTTVVSASRNAGSGTLQGTTNVTAFGGIAGFSNLSYPLAQTAGSAFSVTANAVDANWNLVTNVSDLIGITASDANAVLPPSMALVSGTKTFSVTLKTSGPRTLTASDLSDGSKTANTSAI